MRIKNKQIFTLIVLLCSVLCFPMDRVLAADDAVEIPLKVKQIFELKKDKKEADLTGMYEFRALDADAPMPEDNENNVYSFSMEGETAETILSLQYFQAGIYHYQLKQVTEDKDQYQYDRSCYTITVYIKNDEKGQFIPQVIVEKGDGKKYGELEFQNSYQGKTSEDPNPSEPKTPVKTGDQTNAKRYLVCAAGALLLIIMIGKSLANMKRNR